MTDQHVRPAAEATLPAHGGRRYAALDGLRGLAALVVLLHHSLLITPAISSVYLADGRPPAEGSVLWWLTYSPLKLTNAGPEAVIVFFVLSGFVLAIPVLRGRFDWVAYFPRRFVRLMVPVAAAVALAAVLVAAVPQRSFPRASMWVDYSSSPEVTWTQILNAINLFNGAYSIDNPLWSIQWEMIFSFTLPLFVLVAIVVRRWWATGIAVSIVAVWIGALANVSAFVFLPVFMVGVLMAAGVQPLTRLSARINAIRFPWTIWSGIAAMSVLLMIAKWVIGPAAATAWLQPILAAFIPLGAALLVFCALGSRGFGRLLVLPPLRFAGRISFSLYLVHVPLIVAIRHALPTLSENVIIVLAIPSAIVVAIVFHRLIEAPAHRLSGFVGRRAASALEPERTTDREDPPGSADAADASSTGRRGSRGHSQTPAIGSSGD